VVIGLLTWLVRILRRPTLRRLDRIDERVTAIEKALRIRDTD
jgi:hypothetical protein